MTKKFADEPSNKASLRLKDFLTAREPQTRKPDKPGKPRPALIAKKKKKIK